MLGFSPLVLFVLHQIMACGTYSTRIIQRR